MATECISRICDPQTSAMEVYVHSPLVFSLGHMHCKLPQASVLRWYTSVYTYAEYTTYSNHVYNKLLLHTYWSVSGVVKSLTLVNKLDKTCTLHLNTSVFGYSLLACMHAF